MQSYQKNLGTLEIGKSEDVSFDFTQREDVPTSRYTLKFKIAADGQEEAEKQFYVNTTAKPEQKSDNKNNKDDKNTDNNVDNNGKGADSGYDASYQSLDAGGYSNGDAVYSGGVSDGGSDGSAASGDGSVPRVIVTGFSTDPTLQHRPREVTSSLHHRHSYRHPAQAPSIWTVLLQTEQPISASN